jgi:hypothetical protein
MLSHKQSVYDRVVFTTMKYTDLSKGDCVCIGQFVPFYVVARSQTHDKFYYEKK